MQAAQRTPRRTWRFPRPLVEDQIFLAILLWIAALVVTFGAVLVIGWFTAISVGGWEITSGAAQWYVGIISGWMTFTMVPLFIAHGKTRRDAAIEWSIVAAILVVLAAFQMMVGFLVEHVMYRIGGWDVPLDDQHLFSSRTDVGLIFLQYLLAFAVWAAVGGFVGAAIYRSTDAGWLAIIPGALLIGLSGGFDRTGFALFGMVTRRIPSLELASVSGSIAISLVCAAIALALGWLVVRDMPLRNR